VPPLLNIQSVSSNTPKGVTFPSFLSVIRAPHLETAANLGRLLCTNCPPQVVLVSSMGVTKPDNPLNCRGDGKILMWKLMAEEYLVNSGQCRCS
jgi:hypothetical protein